jgi:hypothetical protein
MNTNTNNEGANIEGTRYEEDKDNTSEQNKKRKNENNLTTSTTTMMEQTQQMEVEEMVPTAQSHDIQQGENETNQQ